MHTRTISATELHEEIERGGIPEILDIRNSEEFAAQKVEGRRCAYRHAAVYEVLEDPERFASETRVCRRVRARWVAGSR